MVTLQNCLDKIGFSGTPTVSLVDLNDLFSKFIMSCPISTIHVDGTLLNDAEASKTRVITDGVGGTCMALAVTFKFMMDQVGFDCDYISIKNNTSWDLESGLIVNIGIDSYFLIFGYYNQEMNKPIKIEDGFTTGNLEIQYLNPEYSLKNNSSQYEKVFLTEPRTESYFMNGIENQSQSGKIVDNDYLAIYLGSGLWRTYWNGKIRENEIEYDYDSNEHDLLTLFKFNGTI